MIHPPASGNKPSIEQGEAVEEAIQVPSSVGSRSTIDNHGSNKKENLISTHPTFRLKFAFEGGDSCCGYRNLRLGDLPQLSLDSLLTEVRSMMIMEAASSSSVNSSSDITATTTTLPTTTTTTTVHPHHDHTKITLTYQDKDGDLAIIGSTLEFIYGILEFQEVGSLLIYVKLTAAPSLFASVPNNTVPTTSTPTGTNASNSSTTTSSNSSTVYANVAHTPETAGPVVVAVTAARPTRSRNDPPGVKPNSRAVSPATPAEAKEAASWTTRPFVPAVATRQVVPMVTKTPPPAQSTAAATTITNNNSNSSARTNTTCCLSDPPARKESVAASDPPPKPAAVRTSVAAATAPPPSKATAHARATVSSTTSQQKVVTAPAAGPGPTRAVSPAQTKAAVTQSPPTPRRAAPATNSSTKTAAVPVAPIPHLASPQYPSISPLPPHMGQYCTARTTMTMMMQPPTLPPPPASPYVMPPPHPPASPYAMPPPHPPAPPPQAMPLPSPTTTPVVPTPTGSSSSSRTTTRTKTPTKRKATSTTKTRAVKKPKTTAASRVKSEQQRPQQEAKTNNNNTTMSVNQDDASLEGGVVPVTSNVTPLPAPKVGSTSEKICNSLMELRALNIYKPPRIQVALSAGYSNIKSNGFVKSLSQLCKSGLISYPDKTSLSLTQGAVASLPAVTPPPNNEALQERICRLLVNQKKGKKVGSSKTALIFDALKDGKVHTRQDIANAIGYTNLKSDGFVKGLSALSSMGLLSYPDSKTVVMTDIAFPYGRPL